MAIKLLAKSEVDRLKASEQRVAVEEGLKVARRVDRLREVSADTEAAYKKFRDESIAKINEEIAYKQEERAKVTAEVNEATALRDRLQKPLDDEWVAVRIAKREADERAEKQDARQHLLDDREREVELTEKKVIGIVARATTREEASTTSLRDASAALNKANLAQASAERIKEDALKYSKKVNEELMHRDAMASSRERSATIKEQDLVAREKALADGWKLLDDRTALFERTIKRVNKKSNGN